VSAENATRLQQRGEAIASQPAEAIAPPAASVPRLRRTGRWSWTLTFSVGLPSASSRWSFDVLALLPLFVVGLVLRLVHLDGQSLWIDELSQARTARLPIPAIFDRISRDVAATPLDYLGEKLTTGVFGIGTFQVRLWAFGAGCLAVAAIYVAARQLSGSRLTAALASGMLATSAFHVYYSQDARFYSLAMLVSLLNVLAFHRAWTRPGRVSWLLYALSVAALLYTHYFASAIVLSTEAVYAMGATAVDWRVHRADTPLKTRWQKPASWAVASALGVVAFAPWLFSVTLPQLGTLQPYGPLPPLDADFVTRVLKDIFAYMVGEPGATALTQLTIALGLIGAASFISRRQGFAALLLVAVVASIPMAWVADERAHYFWNSRQVAFIVPLTYLLAAEGVRAVVGVIGRLRARALSRVARVCLQVAALLVLVQAWLPPAVAGVQRVNSGGVMTEDWRGAAYAISESVCSDATIYSTVSASMYSGVGFYLPTLTPRMRLIGTIGVPLKQTVQETNFGPHDWLVVLTYGFFGPQPELEAELKSQGWTEKRFVGILLFRRGAACPERIRAPVPTRR